MNETLAELGLDQLLNRFTVAEKFATETRDSTKAEITLPTFDREKYEQERERIQRDLAGTPRKKG